jgi:hypothetical protein
MVTDWTDRDSVEAYRRRLVIALHYEPAQSINAQTWNASLEKCATVLAQFEEQRRNSPWANPPHNNIHDAP